MQPSQRIFSDGQYEAAGATVTECLDEADILFGVKVRQLRRFVFARLELHFNAQDNIYARCPQRVANESDLLPDKTYFFFSHVIKGQPENMALLQAILDKNIQLFDYEAIAEDVTDPESGKVEKRREFCS